MNENVKVGADINAGDGGYSIGTPEEYEAFVQGRNQSLTRLRIREFTRVSRLDVYGLGAKQIPWEDTLERYTHLVVAECAKIADQHTHDGDFDIAKLIKQHFGVEE
jgi:hypothetical protein